MICKALQNLFLLLLWPLVLSLTVLKSCWPPHRSSNRTGQSYLQAFSFAFFPSGKALCSDSHTGQSLTSVRFHHTNACPDHSASQWNPKPNPTWFFLSPSHFLFLPNNFFFYLTCYVSSWNLWEWHWLLPVHWDTILFYDYHIVQKWRYFSGIRFSLFYSMSPFPQSKGPLLRF